MERRSFLRAATLASAGAVLAPASLARALATTGPLPCRTPVAGFPYGPLADPDGNGIRLPAGFSSRIVATTGQPVGASGYLWHPAPDGGAVLGVPGTNGDYVYVSNAETLAPLGGGASAIRFRADGEIVDAYRILAGTNINCAGGATPWGTWLSGEEIRDGQVWECNPYAPSQGVPRPALGIFTHEAAAVDHVNRVVYLTEDVPDGRLYRFTPASYPDLSNGRLDVARVVGETVQWIEVSNGPIGATRPRPAGSTAFNGGEGIWWAGTGMCFFTTKGDNRVWRLDTRTQRLCVVYDDDAVPGAALRGVDNVSVSRGNEVLVAEDGDDLQMVVLRAGRVVGPLLRLTGQAGSELTGPAFGPLGDRLYFSSQRALGGQGGVTYEVRGPFRGRVA